MSEKMLKAIRQRRAIGVGIVMSGVLVLLLAIWLAPLKTSAQGGGGNPNSGVENTNCIVSSTDTNCTEGVVSWGNITMSPSEDCIGTEFSASASEVKSAGGSSVTVHYVASNGNPSTNCPDSMSTSVVSPSVISNWWTATVGDYSTNGDQFPAKFTPTSGGNGTVTFFKKWQHICDTNTEISTASAGFHVNVGLRQITSDGWGTGPLYVPDWTVMLGNIALVLRDIPLSFSGPIGFETSKYKLKEDFCCKDGGSGVVDYARWSCSSSGGVTVSKDVNTLSALATNWIGTAIGIVETAWPTNIEIINQIKSLASLSAGFSSSANVNMSDVKFSDSCEGCMQNPEMTFLGTSWANVNGDYSFTSSTLGISITYIGGYVNAEKVGWIVNNGINTNLADWNVQTHLTWWLYWSYQIGSEGDYGTYLPQGGRYFPLSPEANSVCLGPNYPGTLF
jgi:hypothetical protein